MQSWARAATALYHGKSTAQRDMALANISQWFNYGLHPRTFAAYSESQQRIIREMK